MFAVSAHAHDNVYFGNLHSHTSYSDGSSTTDKTTSTRGMRVYWSGVPCLATFAANDGGLADQRSGFQRLGRAAGRALDDDVFGGELVGGGQTGGSEGFFRNRFIDC